MKIKVATPEKKEVVKQVFVDRTVSNKRATVAIKIDLLVDSTNTISAINYMFNGKAKTLKVLNGDLMFQWAEMENDFELMARKAKLA
jgi:hypothetical protein